MQATIIDKSKEKMDCHELLHALITKGNDVVGFDDNLQRIMPRVLEDLSEDVRAEILGTNENSDNFKGFRFKYIQTVVHVLKKMLQSTMQSQENDFFSVSHFRSIKSAIELIVANGIVPFLLPGVGADISKHCATVADLIDENLTDLEKYERLKFSTNSLMFFYNEMILRPVVLSQMGLLLASLLQLSHVPLAKPTKTNRNSRKVEFYMTQELYDKLQQEQTEWAENLQYLMLNSPQTTIIRELMVILGGRETPTWLRKQCRKYLMEMIIRPNGIVSLVNGVCEETLDLGADWKKLITVSRLIATAHGNDPDRYYDTVSYQLLELLSSRTIKHAATIANCCIAELYDYKPEMCIEKIVKRMSAPLIINENCPHVSQSEESLDKCLDNLTKCFVTAEARFNHLPCALLTFISVPLFSLHIATRCSAFASKGKVRQLLLKVLEDASLSREHLIAAFLGHETSKRFGERLQVKFASRGGVEVIGPAENLDYEKLADGLLDLASSSKILSNNLFDYLLKYLSMVKKRSRTNVLETAEGELERISEQLAAVKLLSSLTDISAIRDSQLKNPAKLFAFITSLFDDHLQKNIDQEEEDVEILYVGLMLVKMIACERGKTTDWAPYRNLACFLKKNRNRAKLSTQLATLIGEVIELIETRGKSERLYYEDLSADREMSRKFDEALRDMANPLLPVRAHGLITLTKLIETKDTCAVARKGVILNFFLENLKHDDSFIYLAAINGLCALATSYPQLIVETLVQEFVNMRERVDGGELSSETRMKLGEILVKTTRALGDMTPAYKNTLVNGFLCVVRDPDPLVRASSLSCLGELCKVMGFKLGNILIEVIYCITCVIKSDKSAECRRAALLVCTLLLRGLGRDTLTELSGDLVGLYHGLIQLRNNDADPVMRLHAQLALEEIDEIVREFLFAPPKLQKNIFLLGT